MTDVDTEAIERLVRSLTDDLKKEAASYRAVRAQLAAAMRVVDAARAWRGQRNFDYRRDEINPHLLTAHHEDLDLARAVDEFDQKAPPGRPESTESQDQASGDHADTPTPGNDATATATTEGARAIRDITPLYVNIGAEGASVVIRDNETGGNSRTPERAYRCPHCRGWHLTSQDRRP